ncbi:MAG: CAP domain-containing protein [Hyphomicrobiaceae bacterium]|nr:CAP domain-containing protein [Hyphomicrobiaceae bacterium]
MAELPDLAKTEVAVVERTNAFRKTESLQPVERNSALDNAAKKFAQYLAKSGRFAHEADGRQPADRVREAGYQLCMVAENLASNLDSRGFTPDRLADEAVEGWKASPGHRKNLMLPNVIDIGVGVAQAPGPDPKYLTVQLFGRPIHLTQEFRVVNRSHDAVTYTVDGKAHTVEPRVTIKHVTCDPIEVVFERSGAWPAFTRLGARYKVRSGAEFILRPGPGGRVNVDLKM